jgi:hypothetical protein
MIPLFTLYSYFDSKILKIPTTIHATQFVVNSITSKKNLGFIIGLLKGRSKGGGRELGRRGMF